jgi:hypothetical protein
MGRCGCERHATHLRWLSRRTCSDGPVGWLPRHTGPGGPNKRRDLREQSCGHLDHDDRPHIRRCEAVSEGHCALSPRAVSGPSLSVARVLEIRLALSLAFEVALAQAVEIVVALILSLALGVAVTVAYALVIPLADGLRPVA